MPNASFTKAEIAIEDGPTIQCWVNPETISVSRANTWNASPVAGQSMPAQQFGGGSPMETTVKLLFDRFLTNGRDSVRTTIDKLFAAMEATLDKQMPYRGTPAAGGGGGGGAAPAASGGPANVNNKRPPTMTFSWGRLMPPLQAVCTNLTVAYDLFDTTGEPLRAEASLTLKQATPTTASGMPQNPTTRAIPGLGSHLVRDGDSLPSLAYSYYGDATNWRPIAEANALDNPMALRRGQPLFIPRID